MGFKVDLKSNRKKVTEEMGRSIERALTAVGIQAVSHTVANITAQGLVDTGNMRNSISSYVEGDAVYVGTPVDYAVYQELGTSRGIKPHHFLKDAIDNHKDEYKSIIEEQLKS